MTDDIKINDLYLKTEKTTSNKKDISTNKLFKS